MKYKILILLIVIIFLNNSFSQDSTWAVYDTSNSNLPTNYINHIKIDSLDTKWIGTVKGLVKISTEGWEIYDSNNTPLLHNHITNIAIDHTGDLWIGTASGLAYYDKKSWFIYTKENSGLLENFISALAVDSLNRIWIGSYNAHAYAEGGLSIFDRQKWTNITKENSSLPDNRIESIKIEHENLVWLGTLNGLVKIHYDEMEIFNYSNSNLLTNHIASVDIDKYGSKWIAVRAFPILYGDVNSGGLIMMKDTNMTICDTEISDFPRHNSINTVSIDKKNNVWFGMEQVNDVSHASGAGLGMYNFEDWNCYLQYFLEINTIAFTKNNEIWVGTDDGIFTNKTMTSLKLKEKNQIYSPNQILLFQNYPNPFNPITNIVYDINIPGLVSLIIYDLTGRVVETIVDEFQYPGTYTIKFDAKDLATGIYIYKIKIGNIYKIKKMILIQ